MTCFLVERSMPGMTDVSLAALQRALTAAADRLTASTSPVRYIGSIYLPRRDTCLCLFEAPDEGLVRAVNDNAQAPFDSIQASVVLLEKGWEHP
jgi:hypothetical protein